MIVNGNTLLSKQPIKNMETGKIPAHGVTYGLGEAGYDIRIKQRVVFSRFSDKRLVCVLPGSVTEDLVDASKWSEGRFALASAIEEFQMPNDLVGVVHDKSSWARKGLSVFNTVIESGWCGWLTLELVYHGDTDLIIPAGSGIAQVLFHSTTDNASYSGRYQHQPNRPVQAIQLE